VFGVAENVDAAVIPVGLAEDWNLGEYEFEFSGFLRQKFVKFPRQESSIVLVHSRRRILMSKMMKSQLNIIKCIFFTIENS
jgi:hypothetical protein